MRNKTYPARRVAVALAALSTAALCTHGFAGGVQPVTGQAPTMSLQGLTTLSQYGQVVINPNATPRGLSVLPLNSPPINGFTPQIVFGLTDEHDRNDGTFEVRRSVTPASGYPGAQTLPLFQSAKYFVGIFDTGSQAHLITRAAYDAFDVVGANREGAYQQTIEGVNGTEETDITDCIGIYSTGFTNASVNNGTIGATFNTLRGQWECPILAAQADSALPNLIGSPMVAQYQTTIRNSVTRHLTVGTTTFRSPDISFGTINTATPGNYSKLTLNVQSGNGITPQPVFIPSIDNFNDWSDDPTTPGFWGSLTAAANATHTAGSSGNQDFLFDTGADVSVVSEDTAASVGFYTGGENPSTPDFYVTVDGVGGTSVQVPGFYMNQLSITTNGGPITWTHVPVLVLNIPDPRDFVGFIPGILGMNLFSDRDLILNGGLGNPFLAISPIIAPQWTATGGGTWSDDTKWSLGTPDGADAQANFLSSITAPSTITVDSQGFTVGQMKFDNANRYTIAGPGTITLSAMSTGVGLIQVVSGSHTISAPLKLLSPSTIDVQPSNSTLTISGDMNGGTYALTKIGAGAALMKHVRAGTFSINAGTVAIAANGTNAATSKVSGLVIAGGAVPTATLDLSDNDLIVTNGSYSTITAAIAYARHGGAWDRPGITSSQARAASPPIKTLGTLTGTQYFSVYGGGANFDGLPITSGSLLVKFTWYGDTDFNGKVDGADYARVDTSYNSEVISGNISGWFNGDLDYNNKVDGADYALIDAAFNAQNGTLRPAALFLDGTNADIDVRGEPALATMLLHFQQFGEPYALAFLNALPEPSAAFAIFACLAVTVRRRRDSKG